MVLIESTELVDSLSLLMKMSQEFRMHETSKTYGDIIRLIRGMENEAILEKRGFECFSSYKGCRCMED